jgi:CSLREA domain-containing protein
MRTRNLNGAIALAVTAAALAGAGQAGAATINVNTTADEFGTGSQCALREALEAAETNAAFGGCPAGSATATARDEIHLQGLTYRLTRIGEDDSNDSGDLDPFGGTVNVSGPLKGGAVIDATAIGATGERVMEVGGDVILTRLTLRGGNSTQANSDGPSAGGISNFGTLSIVSSTLTDNHSQGNAGAISTTGELSLTNVTISGNTTEGEGGGVDNGVGADTTIVSSTITKNTADSDMDDFGIVGNGGGVVRFGIDLKIRDTIIAGNRDATPSGMGPVANDCQGNPTSQGNNLIGDTAGCMYSPSSGDVINTNPGLLALRNNGGRILTHALKATSRARNAGSNLCPSLDERGAPRRLAGRCDIGAYERVLCARRVVNVIGTDNAETIRGTSHADGILGLSGRDILIGRGGKDGLCGGKGRDTLKGGAGADGLNGGPGRDKCIGGPGRDRLKRC